MAIWAVVLGALYIAAFVVSIIVMVIFYPHSALFNLMFGVQGAQAK